MKMKRDTPPLKKVGPLPVDREKKQIRQLTNNSKNKKKLERLQK